MTRLSRPVAALVGVVSVAAALAAGHLVAGVVDPDASPFVAVGNAVRDLSPAAVTGYAIANLGDAKKPLLFTGVAAVLLLAAAVAGLLSRRRAWPGLALAAAVGGTGMVAVLTRPDVAPLGTLAPVASLIAGIGTFAWLHAQATKLSAPPGKIDVGGSEVGRGGGRATPGEDNPPETEPQPETKPASRRRFFRTSAGIAVSAGVLGGAGQLLANRVDVAASRAGVGRLTPAIPAPAIPEDADFARIGTPRFLTSNRDFYRVDTALTVPRLRAEDWRLHVHGLVDRELDLTFADIRRRQLVERTITMTCVSNEVGGPYVSTANFIGVPLRDLLLEAGVRPGADQLLSTSVDGWTAGTPVEAVLDPLRGALLAIGMNGEPLPVEHGFPARLVVPGLYGFVSATKWVTDLELTTFAAKRAYWLNRGWGRFAPIKTQSRIDVPRGLSRLPAGPVTIAGVAWAQHIGIDRVEVRVDGGAWQPARLTTEVNTQTWRMWRTEFELSRGTHQAEVRATDRAGRTQPRQRVAPIPDGATGWHNVQFFVD